MINATQRQKGVRGVCSLFSLVILLAACTCTPTHRDMSAEEVVEAYLNTALNMETVEEKHELMQYTTGNLKDAIAGATDETIHDAYIVNRYKLSRFSLVSRRDLTPRETEISFRLAYEDRKEGSEEAVKVVTENTVALTKEKGRWLIRDVIGNRTSIDFPISEASRISGKP
ncbi:MAG: hypothetical protein HYW48_08305 [Deltaproteobacteria bacterium]|nr:hypothetical protein [Deltaproteobacteria bacterium]